MSNVVVNCPDHGEMQVKSIDMFVGVDRAQKLQSTYRFICGIGRHSVVKEPGTNIIDLLIDAGARQIHYDSTIPVTDLANRIKIDEEVPPLGRLQELQFKVELANIDTAIDTELGYIAEDSGGDS